MKVSLAGRTRTSELQDRPDLLVGGDVASDVLDADRVLDRQPMALALDPCLVNDDAAVGREAWGGRARRISSIVAQLGSA
jgi:hypothetical protein